MIWLGLSEGTDRINGTCGNQMAKLTVEERRLIMFMVMRIGRERVSWTGIRCTGSIRKDENSLDPKGIFTFYLDLFLCN